MSGHQDAAHDPPVPRCSDAQNVFRIVNSITPANFSE